MVCWLFKWGQTLYVVLENAVVQEYPRESPCCFSTLTIFWSAHMTQATSGTTFPITPVSDATTQMATRQEIQAAAELGMYANAEHDACGVGFVAHIKGQKAHSIVQQGLKILENIDHRGAVGADPLMGDGAGVLHVAPWGDDDAVGAADRRFDHQARFADGPVVDEGADEAVDRVSAEVFGDGEDSASASSLGDHQVACAGRDGEWLLA